MRHERIASAAPKGSLREYSHTGTAPLGSAASSECGLAGMRTRQRGKCAPHDASQPRAAKQWGSQYPKHFKGQAGWSTLARGSENSAAVAVTRGRQRAAVPAAATTEMPWRVGE